LDEPNLTPPPVHITRFRIFEQDTAFIDGIKLKHDKNYLRFDFVGLCLTAPETVDYKYKLEGIDKDWKNSNIRTVQYTSLPPGHYTFLVKAQNNDGIWSEQPAELNFIITPPFWKTWWFIVTIIVLLVGTAYGWHEKRVRNIERQRKKLETQVTERTKALQELNATKDKFFSIIAHDLKNSLQVQLSGSRLLSERIKNIDKKMIVIIGEELKTNTENLFALLENLLHWSRIQTGRIEHHPAKVELQELVDESLRLHKGNAREKGVRLDAEVEKGVFVYADKYMINSVIQNLISNAVKFTKKRGKVEIASKVTNGDVQIAVVDTGVGMKEDDIKKLFRIDEHHTTLGTADEKGSGLGLILCKEFVEKNRGKIWIKSNWGEGTTVYFTLPVVTEN
jgi:signal transduction histidine kinase